MIMIIAIIYIFFILYDTWLTVQITFRKSSSNPWKNPLPPFYPIPPKNSRSASPPLFANIENFSALLPPAEREGEDTMSHMIMR